MNVKNINSYHKLPIFDGLEMLDAKFNSLDFPKHKHATFNISLIVDNTFKTQLEDKLLAAPSGAIAITNPDEIHATPCDPTKGVSFFTFYISPEVFKTLNEGASIFFNDRTIYNPQLFNQMHFLASNFYQKDILFERSLSKAIKALLDYAYVDNFNNCTTQFFQEYIQDLNLHEKFSLKKAADEFGINKYKFLRLFKQETGLTPTNYLLYKRIERSKKLLNEGNNSRDVAIASGFYDASHFHRNFIRFTGVTPEEYRQAIL